LQNLNHSRPIDVHVWSEHTELDALVDELWLRYFQIDTQQTVKRGPKSKASKKSHLKTLLLDLYVCWLNDPQMYLAVHMSKSGWKANSRYNALHLSSQMIVIIKRLVELDFLEFHTGYEGRLSRVRAHERLQILFKVITIPLTAVVFHHTQEVLELRGDADTGTSSAKPKLEYCDTEQIKKMRRVLEEYNALLNRSHIDVCSLEEPYLDRVITKGIRAGDTIRVHIDHRNTFVKRVFNNSSWELGGRFYGGWWQQIDKDLRTDIMINDTPTLEIDYKSMHVTLLMAAIGQKSNFDPYTLSKTVFPKRNDFDQRSAVKQLVLMAINANDRKTAFAAFRNDQSAGHSFKSLTNLELAQLLEAFIKQYPRLEMFLCSGKGLELMYIDSCIAENVIEHFTELKVPILCMHDSFIVPYDYGMELRAIMVKAGAKQTRRYMFTEKDGVGRDEWFSEYENTGNQPKWEPKDVVRCEGYLKRTNEKLSECIFSADQSNYPLFP